MEGILIIQRISLRVTSFFFCGKYTSIGANGLVNEGLISTQMGLPGKPAMAEELMVARDIKLARYAIPLM